MIHTFGNVATVPSNAIHVVSMFQDGKRLLPADVSHLSSLPSAFIVKMFTPSLKVGLIVFLQ
jgi:hypothetical protein